MATTPVTPPSAELPPVNRPDPETLRLQGEVARQRQELDQIRQRVTAPPQPAANNQQMSSADMAREFYKDPVGHSVAIANRILDDRMKANDDPGGATLIQLARDSIRNRSDADRKLFDKYILEIEAAISTVAPQFHKNITVWENAFKMVKGNHIDEILAERQLAQPPAGAPALHLREGGPEPPSRPSAQPPGGSELTSDEKYTARKLGLTEDQYKQGKIHIEGQNDPVRDPVGKSSWDPFITFDSRAKRRELREKAKAKGGR